MLWTVEHDLTVIKRKELILLICIKFDGLSAAQRRFSGKLSLPCEVWFPWKNSFHNPANHITTKCSGKS